MVWCTIECSRITGTERTRLRCTTGAATNLLIWISTIFYPTFPYIPLTTIFGALVNTWLFAVACLGLRLGLLFLSSTPFFSSLFFIISIDNLLLNAWKYIMPTLFHTQCQKQRNEMHWLQMQQERKQAHVEPINVLSMFLQWTAAYCTSDCCHQHNAKSQDYLLFEFNFVTIRYRPPCFHSLTHRGAVTTICCHYLHHIIFFFHTKDTIRYAIKHPM